MWFPLHSSGAAERREVRNQSYWRSKKEKFNSMQNVSLIWLQVCTSFLVTSTSGQLFDFYQMGRSTHKQHNCCFTADSGRVGKRNKCAMLYDVVRPLSGPSHPLHRTKSQSVCLHRPSLLKPQNTRTCSVNSQTNDVTCICAVAITIYLHRVCL